MPQGVRDIDRQRARRTTSPRSTALLDSRDDIAAVILIADQAGTEYLQAGARSLTRANGVVLIFDEVVTGFRYAPGGAQEYYGVTPDLTTLAKILAGGLPGGAVAGRADILTASSNSDDADWVRHQRIPHPGTYNANPLSAAAGIACLEIVQGPGRAEEGQRHRRRDSGRLQRGLRAARRRRQGGWTRFGGVGQLR